MYSLAKKTKPRNKTTKTKLPSTTAKTKKISLNIAESSDHWIIGLSVGVGVFVFLAGFSKYTLIL